MGDVSDGAPGPTRPASLHKDSWIWLSAEGWSGFAGWQPDTAHPSVSAGWLKCTAPQSWRVLPLQPHQDEKDV